MKRKRDYGEEKRRQPTKVTKGTCMVCGRPSDLSICYDCFKKRKEEKEKRRRGK